MNPSFQQALAARLLWVDVVVSASMEEGCEKQTEAAIQAAYDAVHELASQDVLVHRHYGPRAPLILQDVPELADQYNLSYEMYSLLYYTNYHEGTIAVMDPCWREPIAPLPLPYSEWVAAVTARVAELRPVVEDEEADWDQPCPFITGWSRCESVEETAQEIVAGYNLVGHPAVSA